MRLASPTLTMLVIDSGLRVDKAASERTPIDAAESVVHA